MISKFVFTSGGVGGDYHSKDVRKGLKPEDFAQWVSDMGFIRLNFSQKLSKTIYKQFVSL